MKITSTDILFNKLAKQHFLDHRRQHIPQVSTSPQTILGHLNFVTVYDFNKMARTHWLIIWAQQQSYYLTALRKLVDQDRSPFEGRTLRYTGK